MSTLIVEVCKIDKVYPHDKADRLEIVQIKGWNSVVQKGKYVPGQKCVYFPPDSVLPVELSDRLNVTKYLSKGRVRVANLRSFKSYGLVMDCENPDWEVGTDVAKYYNITKWEPPPFRCMDGDAASPHPAFHVYYDMENVRNFPNLFVKGEPVVVTEKIHGMSARLGLIKESDEKGNSVWTWMAGSHNVRRKKLNKEGFISQFWKLFNEEIKDLLVELSECGYSKQELDENPPVKGGHNVIVFGERFGKGVQDLTYDQEVTFRAFDITKDMKYLDNEDKFNLFEKHNVKHVPVLYEGPYNFGLIEEIAESKSAICKNQIKEGVVVVSKREKQTTTETKVFDRTQLKCISFAYLNRKEGTEYH